MDNIVAALLNLGIGGIMAAAVLWLLYYTHTVTLPKLIDTFTQQMEKERAATEKRHQENTEASERRHRECMEEHRLAVTEIRNGTVRQLDAHKETRHALKSLDGAIHTFVQEMPRKVSEYGKSAGDKGMPNVID